MQPVPSEEFIKDFTICVTDILSKENQTRYEIMMSYKNRDWAMDKTLPQFNLLFKQLEKYTYNIGQIQEKHNFKQIPPQQIKKHLNSKLQALALRRDIIRIKEWVQFLHINNFVSICDEKIQENAKLELKSRFSVKDIAYSKEEQILFCLQTQQKFTKKVTSMLKSLFSESNIPVCQISLYLKKHYQWSIELYLKCACFHWNQKSTMLVVATVRDIHVYRIQVQKDYKYEHFNTISMINSPQIISICMSAYNGLIYALSSSSLLIVDINKNKVVGEMPSNYSNTAMLFDQETNIIYIARYPPAIFIFKIEEDSPTPTLLVHFKTERQCRITSLVLSSDKTYLLGSTNEDFVLVFQIMKNNYKTSKHISSIEVPRQSTAISFCQELKLLFTNYKNNILVINSLNTPERSIQTKNKISFVKYLYPQGMILVGDEEGMITFYGFLPKKQNENENQVRKKLPKYEQEDSDEEVDGWAHSD